MVEETSHYKASRLQNVVKKDLMYLRRWVHPPGFYNVPGGNVHPAYDKQIRSIEA